MSKKRIILLVSSVALALFLTTSVVISDSDFGISQFFKEKQQKLNDVDPSIVLVESDQFIITQKEFEDLKENLKLIHHFNKIPFELKDEEIIDRMIRNELLLQYAKNLKIIVTNDEVEAYVNQTKEALEQNSIPELHSIHLELANHLNVSLEGYFTHPQVLDQYKNNLMIEKMIQLLFESGKLNATYTIDHFAEELQKENRSAIQIYNLS